MGIAQISALRSKDPVTKVGACIVSPTNHVLALGYNGMPRGCNDEIMPWGKGNSNALENKHLYVCHAELNAILNSSGKTLQNATLYVTLFPCNECAKAIIQVGIKKVIYYSSDIQTKTAIMAAKKMFDLSKVIVQKYDSYRKNIVLKL